MMLKVIEEFKTSLKHPSVEEIIDLYFFRPIAFVIVKLLHPLPITPNQLSLLSILVGIASGIFFAQGTHSNFIYGGLFYALAHTLDCCDGMVARIKKNGTLTGRIIDGFADYTSATAVFIGMNIGINKAGFEYFLPPLILLALSAASMIIHCIVVDYYKSEFLAHALGKVNSTQTDRELFSCELEKLNQARGRYFDKLMIWLYLGYSGIQLIRNNENTTYDQNYYYNSNKILLHLWTWIGMTTHIFVIIISAFLFKPEIFFYYALGAANIWMIFLLIIQIRTNKRIAGVAL